MRTAELDDWLPSPAIRTRHRREAAASPEALWDAASTVRVADTRRLAPIMRWRLGGRDGISDETTYRELLARPPFIVLAEGEGWSVSGLAGRIWTLARDYPLLDGPEAFRGWEQRDTARVLFAHWVEPAGAGRAALISEARVVPVGRRAALRLRALWAIVGPFERLIGGEALSLAARRAAEP